MCCFAARKNSEKIDVPQSFSILYLFLLLLPVIYDAGNPSFVKRFVKSFCTCSLNNAVHKYRWRFKSFNDAISWSRGEKISVVNSKLVVDDVPRRSKDTNQKQERIGMTGSDTQSRECLKCFEVYGRKIFLLFSSMKDLSAKTKKKADRTVFLLLIRRGSKIWIYDEAFNNF